MVEGRFSYSPYVTQLQEQYGNLTGNSPGPSVKPCGTHNNATIKRDCWLFSCFVIACFLFPNEKIASNATNVYYELLLSASCKKFIIFR